MDEKNEKIKVPKNREKSFVREAMEWILCLLAAFVIAVVIKYFIFTPTLVQQGSMTPTVLNGERVLINRLVRTFKMPVFRGDIVTFERPDATNSDGTAYYDTNSGVASFVLHDLLEVTKISYIKRVIGVAGDHVKINNDGSVYVNDQKLNETYLVEGLKTPITGEFYDLVVPENHIFVMGDNRNGSSDSREFGCIPLSKVEGRVTYRIWPLNKFGKIDK